MTRSAACACGAARVTVTGAPLLQGLCHCQNCRQRTGSAFAWQGYWPADVVSLSGPLSTYDLAPEWGQRRHFCSHCGTTLAWTTKGRPGDYGIAAGGLEPPLPPPPLSFRDSRRFDWVTLPVGCTATG